MSRSSEVGLFDEGYWMYMEDLDLCYRLRQAGWLTWYEPSAQALHVKHGTSGSVRSPRLIYAFHYGMFRFYRSHYAPHRGAAMNVLVYGGIAVKGVRNARRICHFARRFSAVEPPKARLQWAAVNVAETRPSAENPRRNALRPRSERSLRSRPFPASHLVHGDELSGRREPRDEARSIVVDHRAASPDGRVLVAHKRHLP